MTKLFKKLFGKKKEMESTPLPDKPALQENTEIINELPFDMENTVENKNEQNVPEVNRQEEAILPSSEPSLDLRDYNYPTLDLFSDAHRNYLFDLKDSATDFRLPIMWSTQKGSTIIKDLAELKAILVTGTQATGKTSFIHQVLISLLLKKHPSQIKLILADIKRN